MRSPGRYGMDESSVEVGHPNPISLPNKDDGAKRERHRDTKQWGTLVGALASYREGRLKRRLKTG
jgi:hypothetical protein